MPPWRHGDYAPGRMRSSAAGSAAAHRASDPPRPSLACSGRKRSRVSGLSQITVVLRLGSEGQNLTTLGCWPPSGRTAVSPHVSSVSTAERRCIAVAEQECVSRRDEKGPARGPRAAPAACCAGSRRHRMAQHLGHRLRSMPNRRAASRWLNPSTWQACRTRAYSSTGFILTLPAARIGRKIRRRRTFTPP